MNYNKKDLQPVAKDSLALTKGISRQEVTVTTDLRLSLIQQRDKFTHDQRIRKIHKLDVIEAAITFGMSVAVQLQRDQLSGFKLWDSFSMILQSESLLPTELEAQRFKDWAIKQLGQRWYSE